MPKSVSLPIIGPFSSAEAIQIEIEKDRVSSNHRPAVLALARGFSTRQLKPFILSLRQFNKDCEIVIFCENLSQETCSFLTENNVSLVPFRASDYGLEFNIHNSRHFAILDWLLHRLKDNRLPEQLMLTDIRDVVFQSDPFSQKIETIEFFLEHNTPTIGRCVANSSWIKRCFGDDELNRLFEKTISCSGTIFSTGVDAIKYLMLMQKFLLSFSDETKRTICDQGIHNYILYNSLLPNIITRENGDRVLTVGYVPTDEMYITNKNIFYGSELLKPAVIHQWDRNPVAHQMVLRLYQAEPGLMEFLYLTYRKNTRKKFTLNNLRRLLKSYLSKN